MVASSSSRPRVDEAKAAEPISALDAYMLVSRLKRMMQTLASSHLALIENDRGGAIADMKEFKEISASIEPLMDRLVFRDEDLS